MINATIKTNLGYEATYVKSDRTTKTNYPVLVKHSSGKQYWLSKEDIVSVQYKNCIISVEKFFNLLLIK